MKIDIPFSIIQFSISVPLISGGCNISHRGEWPLRSAVIIASSGVGICCGEKVLSSVDVSLGGQYTFEIDIQFLRFSFTLIVETSVKLSELDPPFS